MFSKNSIGRYVAGWKEYLTLFGLFVPFEIVLEKEYDVAWE